MRKVLTRTGQAAVATTAVLALAQAPAGAVVSATIYNGTELSVASDAAGDNVLVQCASPKIRINGVDTFASEEWALPARRAAAAAAAVAGQARGAGIVSPRVAASVEA